MKTIQYLEENDIINADDQVRDLYLLNWYTGSDVPTDQISKVIYWHRADAIIPFWVGKTIKAFHSGIYDDYGRAKYPIEIIRVASVSDLNKEHHRYARLSLHDTYSPMG
jgi:hypothetical protein